MNLKLSDYAKILRSKSSSCGKINPLMGFWWVLVAADHCGTERLTNGEAERNSSTNKLKAETEKGFT